MLQLIPAGQALLASLSNIFPMTVIVSGDIYSAAEEDLLENEYASEMLQSNSITETDQLQATSVAMCYYHVADAPNEIVYLLNKEHVRVLKSALKQRFMLIGLTPDSAADFVQKLEDAEPIGGTTALVVEFPSFMTVASPSNPFGDDDYGVTSHMGLTLHGENAEFQFRSIEYINSEYADPFDVCGYIFVPITDLVNAVYS